MQNRSTLFGVATLIAMAALAVPQAVAGPGSGEVNHISVLELLQVNGPWSLTQYSHTHIAMINQSDVELSLEGRTLFDQGVSFTLYPCDGSAEKVQPGQTAVLITSQGPPDLLCTDVLFELDPASLAYFAAAESAVNQDEQQRLAAEIERLLAESGMMLLRGWISFSDWWQVYEDGGVIEPGTAPSFLLQPEAADLVPYIPDTVLYTMNAGSNMMALYIDGVFIGYVPTDWKGPHWF